MSVETSEAIAPVARSFCDNVFDLMGRVKCRRVVDAEGLAQVYRLRYASYLREGAIVPGPTKSFSDRFDEMPNTWILGFYLDEQLASSLRVSVATRVCRDIPAMKAFADILSPLVDADNVIVDPTRFVIDEDHAKLYPKLAYVTSRASWLATEYFRADYTISTVRTEHQAFYKRFHGQRVLCPARFYPTLIKPLSLMVGKFEENRPILKRYPFLCSTHAEREALFGSLSSARPLQGQSSAFRDNR